MEKFRCNNKTESWVGHIRYIYNYGSHYEIYVENRSGLLITFDETS